MIIPLKPNTKVQLNWQGIQVRLPHMLTLVGTVVSATKDWTWVKWPVQALLPTKYGRAKRCTLWMEPADFLQVLVLKNTA